MSFALFNKPPSDPAEYSSIVTCICLKWDSVGLPVDSALGVTILNSLGCHPFILEPLFFSMIPSFTIPLQQRSHGASDFLYFLIFLRNSAEFAEVLNPSS